MATKQKLTVVASCELRVCPTAQQIYCHPSPFLFPFLSLCSFARPLPSCLPASLLAIWPKRASWRIGRRSRQLERRAASLPFKWQLASFLWQLRAARLLSSQRASEFAGYSAKEALWPRAKPKLVVLVFASNSNGPASLFPFVFVLCFVRMAIRSKRLAKELVFE